MYVHYRGCRCCGLGGDLVGVRRSPALKMAAPWAAAVAADAADVNKQKHYIEDDKWEYRH